MTLTGALFALIFLAGCLLAFARHPVFGAMTYIATLFLSPQLRWWGQGVLEDVRWAVMSAGVTVLALIVYRRKTAPAAPITSHGIMFLLLAMIVWMAIQSNWALDAKEHSDLLTYYVKFFVGMVLVYKCVETERELRLLLWIYVLGCFYFGWIAFTAYDGGRFEDFGGAGLSEANAGALAIVTGIFAGSALFLAGSVRERVALLLIMPFLMNGLVTTVSRSGFLAMAVGGVIFNYFTPQRFRKPVRVLSILAVVLFLMVAGPMYWQRIQSIKYAGEDIEGLDTGGGRLEIIDAQLRMFKQHPLGCGAMCTAVLSPQYLDVKFLATSGASKVRASHNTPMSYLVEHGIPGAIFYIAMLVWIARTLLKLGRKYRSETGFLPTVFPAFAAIFGAVFVGEQFVNYTKFEPRFWFMAILMAMVSFSLRAVKNEQPSTREPVQANVTPQRRPIAKASSVKSQSKGA